MKTKGDGNFHAFIMFDKHDPSATAEANRLSSLMVHKVWHPTYLSVGDCPQILTACG